MNSNEIGLFRITGVGNFIRNEHPDLAVAGTNFLSDDLLRPSRETGFI